LDGIQKVNQNKKKKKHGRSISQSNSKPFDPAPQADKAEPPNDTQQQSSAVGEEDPS
jgi:hypothetical protein